VSVTTRVRAAVVAGLTCAGLLASAGTDAMAQSSGQRREALARVIEKINDPDPLMRIANLEEILARGDSTETQLAIKVALSGTDPDMKSVALRGYAATLHDLYLDAKLPADVAARLENADRRDAESVRTGRALATWRQATSDRLHIRLEKLDAKSGKFVAYGMNRLAKTDDRTRGEGQIVGSRMRINVGFWGTSRCTIEVSPSSALALEGTAACDNLPRMNVSMPMF
jgi:hypothetical protein